MLAIGGGVAYTQLVERTGAHEIQWIDVTAKLGPVRWPKQFSVAFHSRRALVRWLSANTLPPKPAAPAIDFRHRALLLAAVGPRSSTGYSVDVVSVTERHGRIDVLCYVHSVHPSLRSHEGTHSSRL